MQQKAWRIHEHGGSEVLKLETIDVPEVRDDEVLVKVKAGGLNRSDLLWMQAAFFTPELPALIGAEICGVIEKVGSGVTGFAVGDRVSTLPIYTRGAANAYSHFAEYAAIPAEELAHTPEALSDVEGASFMYTTLTQVCGISEKGNLKPGQTLLVTAGSSANGMCAIMLGRMLGAQVIATTRGPSKKQMLLEAGAHEVVVTDEESLSERVMAITGGRGADLIWDCVGGALTNELIGSLTPGGHWIMYGFLDPSPVEVSWPQWFAHQARLSIFSLTEYTGIKELNLAGRPMDFRAALRTTLSLCGNREIGIPIAKTFEGIESVQDAFREMEANTGGGKIAVTF